MTTEIKLSKRLLAIANLVSRCDRCADVGADHGFLLAYLLEKNLCTYGYALDVAPLPLNNSKVTLKKYNLINKSEVILSDGLKELTSKVNTIIIAGMGGHLIVKILSDSMKKIRDANEIILQPNNAVRYLRWWIATNGFSIKKETMVSENYKYYTIIKIEQGVTMYTKEEIIFGPYLLKEKSPTFLEKWRAELNNLKNILAKINNKHSERYFELKAEISEIEKVCR